MPRVPQVSGRGECIAHDTQFWSEKLLFCPTWSWQGLTSRHKMTGLWLEIFGLENWLVGEGHTNTDLPGCCWALGRAGQGRAAGAELHPLGDTELGGTGEFGCSKPIASSFWKVTRPATPSPHISLLVLGERIPKTQNSYKVWT